MASSDSVHIPISKFKVKKCNLPFLTGLDPAHLRTTLQKIVDAVGSDATEQMVENECHVIMKHPVLDSGCQFIARL